jgi:hypothetical protein
MQKCINSGRIYWANNLKRQRSSLILFTFCSFALWRAAQNFADIFSELKKGREFHRLKRLWNFFLLLILVNHWRPFVPADLWFYFLPGLGIIFQYSSQRAIEFRLSTLRSLFAFISRMISECGDKCEAEKQ